MSDPRSMGSEFMQRQWYDWQCKDFSIIAQRMGEPFEPAEKGHDIGENTVNTLFKHGMLVIDDNGDPEMEKLVNEVYERTAKNTVKAYCRLMVDTDFSIHLFHDSKKVEKSGSPLGLRLASALREFGLVNHSIWIEMHSK